MGEFSLNPFLLNRLHNVLLKHTFHSCESTSRFAAERLSSTRNTALRRASHRLVEERDLQRHGVGVVRRLRKVDVVVGVAVRVLALLVTEQLERAVRERLIIIY